jgi:hydroxymethylglutaryl-CoA reductase
VETDIESFAAMKTGMPALQFAQKFKRAVDIASFDRFRAVTHNKGVMNGVDAVVLATGNDFRAVEAGVHAWASGQGDYKSLSIVSLNDDGVFNMKLSLPLSLGTVGGITSLHPMARFSLEMLGNPGSEELMKIVASVGLASNFAAVKSLVTQGIQRGHMKMHLLNVLSSLDASEGEKKVAMEYFENIKVSYSNVRDFIRTIRKST